MFDIQGVGHGVATNTRSRKVQEIRKDPRVCLYYADHGEATGYVALSGRAVLVDDMNEILKRKRAYWDQAFPGLKNLVLIKIVPERLDVLNYKQGVQADSVTWRTPSIELGASSLRTSDTEGKRPTVLKAYRRCVSWCFEIPRTEEQIRPQAVRNDLGTWVKRRRS